MTITYRTIRCLALAATAAAYASCTTTEHDVEVVHTHPVHHTVVQQSTAPTDYGVVNQYDRQSR